MSKHTNTKPRTSRLASLPSTVSFATLGCKTNQFETAAMQDTLLKAGYRVVSFEEAAELVIVNTCTVTSATDAQSRNLIRRARRLNSSCHIIVTGCYAQVDPGALQDIPGVSLVIGNEEKQRLLDYLREESETTRVDVSDIRKSETVFMVPLTSFSGRSRAFVQIQNGCDAFCSYCIIPYARGASRSAAPDDIIEQVNSLVESGYKEVVLTGIHIGGYGTDITPNLTLNELVKRIERETDLHRLRLGSIEPTELTEDLLATIAGSEIICEHLHIPLQAGDDAVLKRMQRSYDTAYFADVVHKIRSFLPDAAICLDVITGFPGETDLEAENTFRFISALSITDLHVFPYSRRPGTPAAEMPGQVPGDISKSRADRLRVLAREKYQRFAQKFIGRDVEVVVEHSKQDGLLKGVSRNYLDIRFPGKVSSAGECKNVRPVHFDDSVLIAREVN